MTLDEFRRVLDRYGGNMRRWPAAERAAAERLVAADSEAAAALADAQRLDDLLSAAVAPVPVDAAMLGAILARAGGKPRKVVMRPTRRLLAASAAAMVLLFIVGFGIGTSLDLAVDDDTTALLFFDGPGSLGEFL